MPTMNELTALVEQASSLSLNGNLSSALDLHTRAADGLLYIARTSSDATTRARARTAASRSIAVITKLKAAGITAQVDALSPDRQQAEIGRAHV